MLRLGVNIDHVATLRNARGESEPEPLTAVALAEMGGADQITIHLREDRRHIMDRDVRMIKEVVSVDLNLEMAATAEMIEMAQEILPQQVTLVPEKREELTTEGGLDILKHKNKYKKAIEQLKSAGLMVVLFLDPDDELMHLALEIGADAVELHTGRYGLAKNHDDEYMELAQLINSADVGDKLGLVMNAGHGLNYANVMAVAAIPQLNELNIGHSIISRSIFTGLEKAVSDMKELMYKAATL
jgi:pyridoxine 5-phosphate synthase